MNRPYFGDNLHVLREHIADASVATEVINQGFYESPTTKAEFPRIQTPAIAGLLDGSERARHPDLSSGGHTFKKAKLEQGSKPSQDGLFGG